MPQSDIAALITALGGRESLQRLLGVGPSAISNYLAKGDLPSRVRPLICQAMRERGYQIDPKSLRILTLPAVKSGRLKSNPQKGSSVLLIVGGGIASYKALEVSRRLQDHGIRVTGVMTKAAPLPIRSMDWSKVF